MKNITYTSLRKNLSSTLNEIEQDHMLFKVSRKNHKGVVMLTEEDYNSLHETLYLLSNPANAFKLHESINQEKEKHLLVDLYGD